MYSLATPVMVILLLICGITDLLYKKVYNIFTLPGILLGFILAYIVSGSQGFVNSFIGFAIGFGLFLIIYSFGGIGGGDVKLMGAVGALGGYPFIINALFFTVMTGGIISLAVVIWQGKLLESFKHVFQTLFTAAIPGMKTKPLSPDNSTLIPYGFAIYFGTLWSILEDLVHIFT